MKNLLSRKHAEGMLVFFHCLRQMEKNYYLSVGHGILLSYSVASFVVKQ